MAHREEVDTVKRQYEVDIADLKEAAQGLQAECLRKESLRNEAMSGRESLQSSNVVLKQEIADLEAQSLVTFYFALGFVWDDLSGCGVVTWCATK